MLINPAPYKPGSGLQDGGQLNIEAATPGYSIEVNIAGTGSDQKSSYLLSATVSLIESGDDGTGVRLPALKPGWCPTIINRSGGSKTIYAHQSELIDGSASVAIGDGEQIGLYCTGDDWIVNGGPSAGSIIGLPVVTLTSGENPGGISNYTGLETVPMVWNGALVQVTLDNLALLLSNYPYGNIAGTSPFDAPAGSNQVGTEVYFNAGQSDGTAGGTAVYLQGGSAGQTGDGGGGGLFVTCGFGYGTGPGGNINVNAGVAQGDGNGGQIVLQAGEALGAGLGGSITLVSGTSSTPVPSGQVLIQSGNQGNQPTGDVLFGSGNTAGTGFTGQVTIKSGDSAGSNSGHLRLATGSAGTTRGDILLDGPILKQSSSQLYADTGVGFDIECLDEDNTGAAGTKAATIYMQSANAVTLGTGGDFFLQAGGGGSTGGNGGLLGFQAGDANFAGATGGKLTLVGGQAQVNNANGGDVTIQGGQGQGTGHTSGNVKIFAGLTFNSATSGNVIITGLPTVDPHVVGALWNSSGVLHISAG